jgi:hypothetical protein
MKVENTDRAPKFNLLNPDGERPQADAADVSAVLLDGEGWTSIVPGSFHFYVTNTNSKPVPFVQFDVIGNPASPGDFNKYRVEVFPTAIAGLAYPTSE